MAQIEKTFEYLLDISRDIQKQSEVSPVFKVFHQDKINAFYSNNSDQLDAADAVIRELINSFVEKDSEGQPITIEFRGNKNWKFKEGTSQAEYEQAYRAFINQPVTITLP